MGIRHWLRKRLAEQPDDGDESVAPSGSIFNAIFGREPPTLHALGEYDERTYPGELQDLLRRREDVAAELREMDLTTRQARVDAIPRLQQMLRTYPHPLAYEMLLHAYVDAGRWDEARGAAFAARERRTQVSRSPYSEIRSEIDRLKEWTPEEVDLVRQEREGTAATVPTAAATQAVSPVEQAAREKLTEPVRQEEEVEAVIQAVSERPVEPVQPDETPHAADAASSADAGRPVASVDVSEPVDRSESVRVSDPGDRSQPGASTPAAERFEAAFVDPDERADEVAEPGSAEPAGGAARGGANAGARRGNGRGGSREDRGGGHRRK
jgi:hypothetical protein